jgi:hypothetical protein
LGLGGNDRLPGSTAGAKGVTIMNELLKFASPLDGAIAELADRQDRQAAVIGAVNHSIEESRLGRLNYTDVPCCIYFYYVRVNTNGRVFVTHHFYPGGDPNDPGNPPPMTTWHAIDRDPQLLKPILEMLAKDARPTGAGVFPKIGESFEQIEWRRKSYIAFFIDEVNWTVAPTDGVSFIIEPKNGVPGTPNHSFFDALPPVPLTMPITKPKPGGPYTDERSALVFINHMKADDAGRDLDATDLPQLFHFLMSFDVAFQNGTKAMRVIFDPDGTNLGPPLPPP